MNVTNSINNYSDYENKRNSIKQKNDENDGFQLDISKFRIRGGNETTTSAKSDVSGASIRLTTQHDIDKANQRKLNFINFTVGEFREIVEDTNNVVSQEKANYETFLKEANNVIKELKKIDSTNKIEIAIDTSGFTRVKIKNGQVATDRTHEDMKKIENELKDRAEEIREICKKGYKYAVAKSMQDYENSTGINFKNMHNLESRLSSGSALAIAEQRGRDGERTTEYYGKMHRYASWAYSTSPKSYQQIDALGHPLNAPNSPNQSKSLLPGY